MIPSIRVLPKLSKEYKQQRSAASAGAWRRERARGESVMDAEKRIAELERELARVRAAVRPPEGGRSGLGRGVSAGPNGPSERRGFAGRGRGSGLHNDAGMQDRPSQASREGVAVRADGRGRGRGRGHGIQPSNFQRRLCKWGTDCRFGVTCTFEHPERNESATGGSSAPIRGGARAAPFFAFLKDTSTAFGRENDVLKFIAAAISEDDQSEVIAGLGKPGGRGQERIREICLWSDGFSTDRFSGRRSPLSFQKVICYCKSVLLISMFTLSALKR